MHKKTIPIVLALLCLYVSCFAQSHAIDYRQLKRPYFIDSWFKKDVPLGKVINYKDTVITLNDFKDKLIILDFWFTHCGDCIAQFPNEDALQKIFGKDIQFILVTFDSATVVRRFLAQWEKRSGIKLSFPIVVEDTALGKAFRHEYDPHYAWLFPDGKIIGQTSEHFVTAENITALLTEWAERKAAYEQRYNSLKKEADKQKKMTNQKTGRQ